MLVFSACNNESYLTSGNEQSTNSEISTDGEQTSNNDGACRHVYGNWSTVKQATCKEEGELVRTCTKCYEQDKSIVAKSNKHKEFVIKYGFDATCTTDGLTDSKGCSVCNIVLTEQIVISAYGHTEEIIPAVAPTCEENGLTKGKKCSVCDEILIEQETVKENGHSIETVEAQAQTCTEVGWNAYKYCSVCNYTTYEEIPANGHTEEIIPTVEPSCTETGLAEGTKCSVCDIVLKKQEKISALGHDYINHKAQVPNCTEIGWNEYQTCSRCNFSTYNELPINEIHTYENSYICSRCDCLIHIASEGIEYELDEKSNTYTVTGIGTFSDTDLVIPYTHNDLPVTSIGRYAFFNCDSLTSIIIPNSVTTIGWGAFESCSVLTSITIPDGVISISYDAFSQCDSITSVNYLGTLEQWCNISFSEYDSNPLRGANLYLNGEIVTSLVMPDTITEIKECVFGGCTSITSLTIPSSVTSIGNYAFACRALTKVNYLGTIEQWCNMSFDDYYANPLNYGANLYLNGEIVTNLVIPSTITEIKDNAFDGCTSITSVTIPNSVISIGDSAFVNCDSLTNIVIPNSVIWIGEWAFAYCDSLTNAIIGNGVERMYEGAFACCPSLKNVTIGNSVIFLASYTFKDCTSLTNIVIPNSITQIGGCTFEGCTSLTSVTFENPRGWYIIKSSGTKWTLGTFTSSNSALFYIDKYYNYTWYCE